MRFMRMVGNPNVERKLEVLASFPEIGFGIVAVHGGTDIVGSALCLGEKDQKSCEFAITVVGDYGGLGRGRALMTTLIGAARLRGLHEMEGYVLAKNQSMPRLASRLGFRVTADPDDPHLSFPHWMTLSNRW